MRVRSIASHANPFGRGRGKRVGTEYDLPAGEANALIAAGIVKRTDAKKPKTAPANKQQKADPKKNQEA